MLTNTERAHRAARRPWRTGAALPALSLAVGAGVGFAALTSPAYAGLNQMAQCALVPAAHFNASDDTAVGLMTDTGGDLHWQFYDQDGLVLERGSFDIGNNAFASFALSANVDPSLSGVQGFLLFCLDDNRNGRINDNDAPDLTANAFLVKSASADVAYIPTLAIGAEDLNEDDIGSDVTTWTDDPIDTIPNAADDDDRMLIRYYTDADTGNGENSTVYLFTTRSPAGVETMTANGPDLIGDVDVPLGRVRLNVVDAEAIPGLTDAGLRGSGFLSWDIPGDIRSAFAFTIAESAAFSAAQTLVGGLDGS